MSTTRPRILVVGGGVIGTSVAFHLGERGLGEVSLLERDRLGSGTTWHSAGNITWKPTADNAAPVAYMWDLLPRLTAETGQETGWRRTGRLFLACSEAGMSTLSRYHEDALAAGVQGTLLTPEQATAHHPLLDPAALAGAWLNPDSGRLNPADLVAAYARAARKRGARIVEDCTVEQVLIEGGRVCGVQTADGPIEADLVVVASGLWSRRLLERSGVPLAHGACEHFYVIADVRPRLARDTPSFICPERLCYGREEVGGFLVGFFDRDAIPVEVASLPEPFTFTLLKENWEQVASYYQSAAELFPALVDAPIRRFVNGPESFTPDGSPLVGPLPEVEGLYAACALNSAGVTYSGMVGHAIADLVEGVSPRFDIGECAPGRFGERAADGDWLREAMRDAPSAFYLRHNG